MLVIFPAILINGGVQIEVMIILQDLMDDILRRSALLCRSSCIVHKGRVDETLRPKITGLDACRGLRLRAWRGGDCMKELGPHFPFSHHGPPDISSLPPAPSPDIFTYVVGPLQKSCYTSPCFRNTRCPPTSRIVPLSQLAKLISKLCSAGKLPKLPCTITRLTSLFRAEFVGTPRSHVSVLADCLSLQHTAEKELDPGYCLVSQVEYDRLVSLPPTVGEERTDNFTQQQASKEYGGSCMTPAYEVCRLLTLPDILRSALFKGGLTQDALNVLVHGEPTDPITDRTDETIDSSFEFITPKHVPVTITRPHDVEIPPESSDVEASAENFRKPKDYFNRKASFGFSALSSDSPGQEDPDAPAHQSYNSKAPFPRDDQRTVFLSNLPEGTTHKDIVNVVRGGRLLDVYLRYDKSATVSFVEGAQDFMNHVKRNDLYIQSKRVCAL